jgi:hypothetical protein
MTGTFTPKWVAPLAPKYPSRTIQTSLDGEYNIKALQILEWEVDSIKRGKFNGQVRWGLYWIEDEDSVSREIKGLKYLPQEFIADYYLILKEAR